MLCVVDIDETVADNFHRQHYLEDNKKDWVTFLSPEEVAKDSPIPLAKEGLRHLREAGWEITFLTGRNERLRDVTSRWLTEHMDAPWVIDESSLIMRPDEEYSKATDYKGRKLNELLLNKADVVMGPKGRVKVNDYPVLYIDDDPFMLRDAKKIGCITLRAPHIWEHLGFDAGNLPEELTWRK